MTSPKQLNKLGLQGCSPAIHTEFILLEKFSFSVHFTKNSSISPVSPKAGNTVGHEEIHLMSFLVLVYLTFSG